MKNNFLEFSLIIHDYNVTINLKAPICIRANLTERANDRNSNSSSTEKKNVFHVHFSPFEYTSIVNKNGLFDH